MSKWNEFGAVAVPLPLLLLGSITEKSTQAIAQNQVRPQSAAPGSCDSEAMEAGREAAALEEAAVPASSWRRHISAAGSGGRVGRTEG